MPRNEAAERLRSRIENWPISAGLKRDEIRKLNEALAAERRATVERIRAEAENEKRLIGSRAMLPMGVLDAILDEEAAR